MLSSLGKVGRLYYAVEEIQSCVLFGVAPLRCATACGSEERIVFMLTRHLFLVPALPELGNVTGLLSVVPSGTSVVTDGRQRVTDFGIEMKRNCARLSSYFVCGY